MNLDKIGEFIAKLRKEKNLTQEELAEMLGVTSKSVSRWENGKTMMDVSLFIPFCEIFGITINELFSGELIKNSEYQKVADANILNSISYTQEKIKKYYFRRGIFLLIIGFLIILTSVVIFPSESSWSSIYSSIGLIISLIGFAHITRKLSYSKRLLLNYGFFTIGFLFLILIDFLNVKLNDEVPMYSLETITADTVIYYNTPFYDVIRCNVNLANEFLIIEKNINYDIDLIKDICQTKN